MNLSPLIYFSRLYGSNPDLVACGGGNTSMKEDGVMYVKGSGSALKDAVTDTFVGMDMQKLERMMTDTYPTDDVEREAKFLRDITNAKLPGEEAKRPSVEALLHALFKQKFVLHLHPSLVNGLTCSVDGQRECRRLFGDSVKWMPECKPGYVLAKSIKTIFDESAKPVKTVLLENHGVFFASDTVEGLATQLNGMLNALNMMVKTHPSVESNAPDAGFADSVKRATGKQYILFNASPTALSFCESADAVKPVLKPFTPDQIVYCGPRAVFIDPESRLDSISANVIYVKGVGVYCVGDTERACVNCMTLVKDAMKIASYADSFGGCKHMNDELVNFIVNWEVESYRKNVR